MEVPRGRTTQRTNMAAFAAVLGCSLEGAHVSSKVPLRLECVVRVVVALARSPALQELVPAVGRKSNLNSNNNGEAAVG